MSDEILKKLEEGKTIIIGPDKIEYKLKKIDRETLGVTLQVEAVIGDSPKILYLVSQGIIDINIECYIISDR